MAELIRPDGAVIHYQTFGTGHPLFALAPGGVCSEADCWGDAAVHPVEAFAHEFTVIVMDQRYAGRSRAPLTPFSYEQSLDDQLAVLDAMGVTSAHVIAADLGCAHALRLLYDAPARISAAVLLEPPGHDDSNSMDVFYNVFNETIRLARAEGLEGVVRAAQEDPSFTTNPGAGPWAQRLHDEPRFRDALHSLGRETYIALMVDFRDAVWPWDRQFFSVNDVAVGRIDAPILVLAGNDAQHPAGVAARICADAPHARPLTTNGNVAATLSTIGGFLRDNIPESNKATPTTL